ncbi:MULTISPECIES: hypothetical protein [unclassified Variovorax]|uniref:hypothetical protein n=1 Tax=unclassified Variovorax TaxID=663243 RepID=UPI001BD1D163|nr:MULTISPECIES: hypothetical protein [unclassified Variovorax]
MQLDEGQASEVVGITVDRLRELGASDVLEGIQESRRAGVEEPVPDDMSSRSGGVGSLRRRPPTEPELLLIVLERLKQRIFIVPEIASAIETRIGRAIEWRVDPEFVDPSQAPLFEAGLDELRPAGLEEVQQLMREIEHAIANSSGNFRG